MQRIILIIIILFLAAALGRKERSKEELAKGAITLGSRTMGVEVGKWALKNKTFLPLDSLLQVAERKNVKLLNEIYE